jgi:hypothetical protein
MNHSFYHGIKLVYQDPCSNQAYGYDRKVRPQRAEEE